MELTRNPENFARITQEICPWEFYISQFRKLTVFGSQTPTPAPNFTLTGAMGHPCEAKKTKIDRHLPRVESCG